MQGDAPPSVKQNLLRTQVLKKVLHFSRLVNVFSNPRTAYLLKKMFAYVSGRVLALDSATSYLFSSDGRMGGAQ